MVRGIVAGFFQGMALCYVEGLVKLLTEEIKKEVLAKNVSKKARKIECYFLATKVLAKHDEKYMPKEVVASI